MILFPGESFFRFPPLLTGVFLTPNCPPPTHPPPTDIYDTHIPPKLTNMEDMDKEQADAVEQVFDLDYDVAQAFCSYIVPKVVLLFTGEAPKDRIDFEPEDGEGDDDDNDEGGDD